MISIEELNKAIDLTKKGHLKDAEEIYLQLFTKDSKNHVLSSAIGLFYASIGNLKKASEFLEKACELNKSQGTLSALGYVEYEKKTMKKLQKFLNTPLILEKTLRSITN